MDWSWPVFTSVAIAIGGPISGFIWANRTQIAEIKIAQEELRGMVGSKFATAREERISQIGTMRDELKAYSDANRRAVDMVSLDLRNDIQGFKLKVSEDYVRAPALREMEARIMTAFEKMDAKIDKIADRGAATDP